MKLRFSPLVLTTALVLSAIPAALRAQSDALPAVPPYCEAGHSGEFGHGTQTASGSSYCLFRQVSDTYATPPEGWNALVGTFTVVTAFYPSSAWGGPPFSPNYPQVVLTYHRGNPLGYPFWEDTLYGFGGVPNATGTAFVSTGNEIELVRVFSCAATDFDCTYEVRPYQGATPGAPAEWYTVGVEEMVDGSNPGLDLFPFAYVAAGIGLVADGNRPPLVSLTLLGSTGPSLDFHAALSADDPDDDAITGYVVDWGDGQSSTVVAPDADHTYAGPGNYFVRAYARDVKGAVGFSAPQAASSLFTVDVAAPTAVDVGEQIVVHVTLTSVATGPVQLAQTGGFVVAPPPQTVSLTSRPPIAATPVPRGDTYVGTWVYDTLRDGTVRLSFGGQSTVTGCPGCTKSFSVQREIVIGSGVSATATATPSIGVTPTPTASPTPHALADRDAAKRAVKCQATVLKARGSTQAAGLKGFDACAGKIAKCVQTKVGDQQCLTKAAAACAKVRIKLAVADAKLGAAIRKACAPLATADVFAAAGLDADAIAAPCAQYAVDPAGTLDGWITCQVAATACTVAELAADELPRLAQLLALAGSDLGSRSSCLAVLANGGGDVGDADLGKSVESCRTAIAKATRGVVAVRTKERAACAVAAFKCIQEKGGDPACLAKAGTACVRGSSASAAAVAGLGDAIAAKCGGIAFPTLAADAGLGLAGLAARCADVGVASLATLDQYVECLGRAAACSADAATTVAFPRIAELLALTGQPALCQ